MPSPPAPKLDAAATIAPVNDLLLRAARRERTERTPVWLMRQAGRFDPKYLAIRDRCGLELEDLFRDPELACEITLLPIRFGVDAAILFQDILTPLAPLGARFVYRPGPVLERPIRGRRDIDRLRALDPRDELSFVSTSIKLVLSELKGALPLIGFAGAPLTLATFMIEGRSPGAKADQTRQLMQQDPAPSALSWQARGTNPRDSADAAIEHRDDFSARLVVERCRIGQPVTVAPIRPA